MSVLCVLCCFSHVQLFEPHGLYPARLLCPLSMGILQARILKWVAMPFFKESSHPRDQTRVSYVSYSGRHFTTSVTLHTTGSLCYMAEMHTHCKSTMLQENKWSSCLLTISSFTVPPSYLSVPQTFKLNHSERPPVIHQPSICLTFHYMHTCLCPFLHPALWTLSGQGQGHGRIAFLFVSPIAL